MLLPDGSQHNSLSIAAFFQGEPIDVACVNCAHPFKPGQKCVLQVDQPRDHSPKRIFLDLVHLNCTAAEDDAALATEAAKHGVPLAADEPPMVH